MRKRELIRALHYAVWDMLEITLAYLSDIEKSRRNPPDKPLLEKIATILKITEDDKNLMFDLAGKGRCEVSPDLRNISCQTRL